jgi:hypothetical protein
VAVVSLPERAFAHSASSSRAIAAFAITLPIALAAIGGAYAELWYAATMRESRSISRGLVAVDQLIRGAAERPGLVLAWCLPGALAVAFVAAARVRRLHVVGVIAVAAIATAACEAATWLALRSCGTAMPEIWFRSARGTFLLVVALPIVDRVVDLLVKPPAPSAEATSWRGEGKALAVVLVLALGLGAVLRSARDARAHTVSSNPTESLVTAQLIREGAPDPVRRAPDLWKELAGSFLGDARTCALLQRVYGEIPLRTMTGNVSALSAGGSTLVIEMDPIEERYASLRVERVTCLSFKDSAPDPPFSKGGPPIADDVLVLLAIQDWLNRNAPGWHVVPDDAEKTPPSDPAALDIIIKDAEKAGRAYFRERP